MLFVNIWDTDKVLLAKEYGETIAHLSKVEKKTNLQIIKTIVLSKQIFNMYYENRYISDDIIDSAVNLLKECGILLDTPIFMGISVYKECLIPIRQIVINNNFTSIKYAMTKLYEAWFDDKPQAYRIAHKMVKEDTFPSVYIQPVALIDNIFSVITRNPVDGTILKSDNYQHIVHCKLPFFNEVINSMLNVIDDVFVVPQKILFTYDECRNVSIIKLKEYPMTKKAYLSMLVEKHRKKHISNEEFLQSVLPDDLLKFDGYGLDVPSVYKQAIGLSPGAARGYVIFTSTDLQTLREKGNYGPYILVADELSPEDIDILHQCSGAIFTRTGMTSHGATICRGMGIPAIGDGRFNIDRMNKVAYALGNEMHEGDAIYICALVECGWSLDGKIVPTFKAQVDRGLYIYLNKVLREYDDMNLFSQCELEFQLHYAEIKKALHKLGVEYESIDN